MCSRTSPKIWLLMLIPVAVLLGIGWMQRNNHIIFKPPRRTTGPLRMIVTDVKFEKLKPREVAEGFDTKVTLTLDLEGQLPQKGAPFGLSPYVRNVRLVETGAKPRVTKLRDEDVQLVENDIYIVPLDSNPRVGMGKLPQKLSFLLNLSKLKRSRDAVELRADIFSYLQVHIPMGRGKNRVIGITGLRAFPGTKFLSVVRRPNQIVQVPQFSKETSLTTGTPQIDTRSPLSSFDNTGSPIIEITVPLFWKDEKFNASNGNPEIFTGHPYIEDAHGKRYRSFQYGKNKYFYFNQGRFSSNGTGDLRENGASYSFPSDAFPDEAGQLTLKTQISANEEWPVPVSVVIRRANQKKPSQFPPFKVANVQVRPIRDDKGDTEVIVQVQPNSSSTNIEAFSRELISDWSQHLVDARGQKYTTFIQWTTWTTFPNGNNAPMTKREQQTTSMDTKKEIDETHQQIAVHYKFFLDQVRTQAGRVTFHAEIGMKGCKFLPVSVVARP
jgi:hypothetical protein